MSISDEAVEAAAEAAYAVQPAKYYLDDSVVAWRQLADSGSGQRRKDMELAKARAALEAAAPYLVAPVLQLSDELEASALSGDNYMSGRGSGFRMAGVRIRQALGLA